MAALPQGVLRLYNWHKIATDRSQHFQGIENGIKRDLSISLLNKWTQDADNLQNSEDANLSVAIDVKHDPRAKMKILRLLLPAGIQTPERDHRRRKKTGDIVCKCNLAPPLFITFHGCVLFSHNNVRQSLPSALHNLPLCFQLTTLVPNSMNISQSDLHTIQSSLVDVWQEHTAVERRFSHFKCNQSSQPRF